MFAISFIKTMGFSIIKLPSFYCLNHLSECLFDLVRKNPLLRWPVTPTTLTKRNTVKNKISHIKKFCCGKTPWQISAANFHGKFSYI